MPNRILREGINTSPRMARLSGWASEVLYRRLMSVVDDFGRYYADSGLVRAACYPRQLNKVSDSDIGKWITDCVNAGLVRVYPAEDGESYLEMLDFRQQTRAKASKFPAPPDRLQSTGAAPAQQMHSKYTADAPVFGDGDGDGDDTPRAARDVPGGGPVEQEEKQAGTPAGRLCAALKAAGIARTNPGHPLLSVLLAAGATEAEFLGAVPQALGKRDPYAYLLQVVKGQREAAAAAATQVHAGPLPGKPVTVASDDADKTRAYLDGLSMTKEQREAAKSQAQQLRRKAKPEVVGDACG